MSGYRPVLSIATLILVLATTIIKAQHNLEYQTQTNSYDGIYERSRGYTAVPQYHGPYQAPHSGSYNNNNRNPYRPFQAHSGQPANNYRGSYEFQSPYSSLYHKLYQDYAHIKAPAPAAPNNREPAQHRADDRVGQSPSGGGGRIPPSQYQEIGNYGDNGNFGRYHADRHRGERPTKHCYLYSHDEDMYEKCQGCSSADVFFVCPVAGIYKPVHAYGPKEEVYESPRRHFAHTDPACYWQCDEYGRAFGQPCPKGLTFNTHAQVCIRV